MRTEKQALSLGNKLLNRMKGKGWKLTVWENIGWYYKVSLGNICVHSSGRCYSTLLAKNKEFEGCGEMFWSNDRCFTDPNEAVKYQMKIAQEFVDQCQKSITTINRKISLR